MGFAVDVEGVVGGQERLEVCVQGLEAGSEGDD